MTTKMRWQAKDTIITILLGVGTALSRLPFHTPLLHSHDAVNYALALEHFDMRLHQPQPPGYPLYVLLGQAFQLLFPDHLAALLALSIVFSGLAVVAIYLVGRAMFGRQAGVVAALLAATSAVVWFQGEITVPYAPDMFASAIVGWLCYRLSEAPSGNGVWWAALAVGLAGAFRLQTFLFLFPLFLYALRGQPRRRAVGGILVAGAIFGLFFIPAVLLSGGPAAFLLAMRRTVPIFWSARTLTRSTRWDRFMRNTNIILRYTFRAMGEWALLLLPLGVLASARSWRLWREHRLCFLALWVLPTWIVYFLIWPGNPGTILVCIPPFFLLAGAGLDHVLTHPLRGFRKIGWAWLVGMLLWRTTVFATLPARPFGIYYRSFDNYAALRVATDCLQTRFALVDTVPVEHTVLYANDFRLLQYYRPQYRIFSLPNLRRSDPRVVKSIVAIADGKMETLENVDTATIIPADVERILLFDLPPEEILVNAADAEVKVEVRGEDECAISVITVPTDSIPLWTLEGLTLEAWEVKQSNE